MRAFERTMNPATLRKLHRWIGLAFSVSALVASFSGILHNVMTWTQPPPPPAAPSGASLDFAAVKLTPADALAKLPPTTNGARAVNLRTIGGRPWYVIRPAGPGSAQYVSADTGEVDPKRDPVFAAEIAARFLHAEAGDLRQADFLTQFNREYINIFRILPVYRFDRGDGIKTRVYVSTMTESVTRHTDNYRQLEANIFGSLHKLNFIPNKTARDAVLTFTTFGIFCVSVAGIVLFFVTSPRRADRKSESSNPQPVP